MSFQIYFISTLFFGVQVLDLDFDQGVLMKLSSFESHFALFFFGGSKLNFGGLSLFDAFWNSASFFLIASFAFFYLSSLINFFASSSSSSDVTSSSFKCLCFFFSSFNQFATFVSGVFASSFQNKTSPNGFPFSLSYKICPYPFTSNEASHSFIFIKNLSNPPS